MTSWTDQIACMPMTDTKHIFDAASDFQIGSSILGEQFGQPIWPLRATVVTGAFAAELYLKCLLELASIAIPKVHRLTDLYELLPPDKRITVNAQYKKIHSDGGDILDVLVAHDATFVDWRYIFDKQHEGFCLDFGTLRDACIALREAILLLRPDWRMPGR